MVELFPPNFAEVGNFGVLSLVENIQENNVTDMMASLRELYPDMRMSVSELEQAMRNFDVIYDILPQYLKDLIDTIDVY